MIYDRTFTSHMKPTEYINHKVLLNNKISDKYGYFTISHKQMIFPGYKIYYDKTLKKENKPKFKKQYELQESISTEKEGNLPQYYDESSVVNLLEKTGIGRPSTYSTIVGTLDNRNYTVKQDIIEGDKTAKIITLTQNDEIIEEEKKIKGRVQKKRIVITPLGIKVLEYLRENFMNIIQKDFTCEVEKDLDLIALGERDHIDIIKKVYVSFIDIVERQLSSINKTRVDLKLLGNKGKKEIFIGDGKYGPYLQIKDKKVKNMNITKYLELIQKSIQEVTFEDALKYLEYPKKINDNIYIHIGPYGYYMKYNGIIYNIQQRKDGNYSEEYCLSLI
jgi:DNA topoisomerase I